MHQRLRKLADGYTDSVLPQIAVPSYPAQDKNTLRGMVPPIAYTKVNASTPPTPDAGSVAQKSLYPMGSQSLPKTAQAIPFEDPTMNMKTRPLVQDLVKQAMDNAARRAQIASEGARQMKLAEEECSKCKKHPCECEQDEEKSEKKASGSITTDYAMKLAAAVEYAAPSVVQMAKRANSAAHITEQIQQQPEGVSHSAVGGTMPGPGQQGKGHHQPPMNPGTQKAWPQEHGATQLENNKDRAPGGPGTQTTAMSGGQGKTAGALFASNMGLLYKLAGINKTAFSVTDAGHALDASDAHSRQKRHESISKAQGKYEDDSPVIALMGGKGLSRARHQLAARHANYVAREHESGHNAFNPVGGLFTKTDTEKAAFAITESGHALDKAVAEANMRAHQEHSEGRKEYTKEQPLLAALTGKPITQLAHRQRARRQAYVAKEHGTGHNALNPFGGVFTPTEGETKNSSANLDHLVGDFLSYIKQAEDAINPAQISAGPAVPPDTNASGEPGGQPVGGAPSGPHSLVHSNDAAINYKKQTAYAPRKSELAAYFSEPALSAATDKTLNEAFAHTGEAGVKISAAQLVKSASARALLTKLAADSTRS